MQMPTAEVVGFGSRVGKERFSRGEILTPSLNAWRTCHPHPPVDPIRPHLS